MRRTWILCAMAMVLGLLPGLSTAAAPPSAAGPYFSAFGSWNTYGMSAANSQIGSFNEDLAGDAHMSKITSDPGLGVQLGTDLRRFGLGLGYERFFASSDVEYSDAWGAIRMKLPANAWYALAEARLPMSGMMRARVGVGAGVVALAPVTQLVLSYRHGALNYAIPKTGSGPMLQGYVTGEWAGQVMDLFASAGYRYAKVSHPRTADTANLSGVPNFAIDYSGATVRLGFKVHLRK